MKHYTCDRTVGDAKIKYFVTSQISENIQETPEGFLVCLGVAIARTGEMIYGEGETPIETDDNGKTVINRSEKEVFSPETIASFEGKPITITHPTEFVSPKNWSQLAKGVLQNVRRGEGDQKNDLIADLLITDDVAINLVKAGLREVSCGYEAEYIQTEEGKGIQTNIIGNHLALVEQGRAGSAYAINDHKRKGDSMTLKEKIKNIFAKAQDEAMKMAEDEAGKEPPKEEKKPEAKDEGMGAYDELVKMVKDLGEKIGAMSSKPKDEAGNPAAGEKVEKKADDEVPPEAGSSMEDRMKKLEAAVAQLLEMKAGDADLQAEGTDADKECEDADKEDESAKTGDTASRAEILAPGIEITKNVKVEALKAAYATKDGKKVIHSLTGDKAPAFDSAEKVETLFIAASELLKQSRSSDFSKTKTHDFQSSTETPKGAMTAERMNEINTKFYKQN